jgi:hypothetical protein
MIFSTCSPESKFTILAKYTITSLKGSSLSMVNYAQLYIGFESKSRLAEISWEKRNAS